jgi:hypothetical protein
MNIKYIKSIFLEFFDYFETERPLSEPKFYRAYEIWEHCFKILDSDKTPLGRIDVISNLKRCLNHRLKNIESNYFINSLPIFKNEKKYFDKLSSLNIIRPFMLQQLFEIRNDIEHNDARPPSIKRTQELLDISWYFLKSTDQLVKGFRDQQLFNFTTKKTSINYWIVLTFKPVNKWEIVIRGWVPKNFISNSYKKDTIAVEIIKFIANSEIKLSNHQKDKLDTDLFIEGILKPDNEIMKYVLSVYFNS